MAIDTRDRRMSMIGLASPIIRLFKNPSGVINAVGRALAEFLYGGIALGAPAVATPRILYYQASQNNALSLQASRNTAFSLQASES